MYFKFLEKNTRRLFLSLIINIKVISAFDCVEELNRKHLSMLPKTDLVCNMLESQSKAVESYISKRQLWQTSNLGTILYKFVDPSSFYKLNKDVTRDYVVLFWSSWFQLLERHSWRTRPISRNKAWHVDLKGCTVKNCYFTDDKALLNQADAVIIDVETNVISLPPERDPNQRWIYKAENPAMTFPQKMSTDKFLSELQNIFNWSMTYRSDADIPIPYGRTVPIAAPELVLVANTESVLEQLVPHWYDKQTVVPAAVLFYDCKFKKHFAFVRELQQYMKVDILGPCFERYNCRGDRKTDCKVLKDYIFYLVLETSSCIQYLTEKCFHNAYSNGAIPVIMGPTMDDCEKLLPPNSFLYVDSYTSVQELAAHMKHIVKNLDDILFYHNWRRSFKVVNEHGYFGTQSPFFCRICEALNYNDVASKSYDLDELKLFFNRAMTCNETYNYFS